MHRLQSLRSLGGVCMLLAVSTAGAWPERDIRLVNPYPVSGPADLAGNVPANRVLRLMQNHAAPPITDVLIGQLQQALASGLGRAVMVERRPRQATLDAHRYVAHAAPDGHTLLLSGIASIVIQPAIRRGGAAAPHDALVPVALVAQLPVVLIAGRASRYSSVGQLLGAARDRPAHLHYGSSGDFSTAHLAGVLFSRRADVRLVHVGYNGGIAAVSAVLSGHVETAFVALPAALPYVRNGRLRALGIATTKRYPELPDVPTIIDAGIPGFEVSVWYGLFAPRHTPREIVRKIDAAMAAGLHTEESRMRWRAQGVQAGHVGGTAFEALLRRERERWLPVLDAILAAG